MPAVIFGRQTFWRQLLKANISNNSGRRLKADVVVAVAEVRRWISSKADILVIVVRILLIYTGEISINAKS
jgi:hypothetical protein